MTAFTGEDAAALARRFYAATDGVHTTVEEFATWLAPTCRMAFNTQEPVVGRDAVAAFVVGRRQPFRSVCHRIDGVVADPASGLTALELTVDYESDAGPIRVCGVAVLGFGADGLEHYRVYVDTAPFAQLFQPFAVE